LAVVYSSNTRDFITTTDVYGKCTSRHSGTSAAAPLAAGIIALLLQARPELTWRDVQHLIIRSAITVRPDDKGWITNSAGLRFHIYYGFGRIDADALVTLGQNWALVPEQTTIELKSNATFQTIANYDLATIDCAFGGDNFHLEHVIARVSIHHPRRGDLAYDLQSPAGTWSRLASPRRNDRSPGDLKDWDFVTVAFWGEQALGTWTLEITDTSPMVCFFFIFFYFLFFIFLIFFLIFFSFIWRKKKRRNNTLRQ